MVAVHAAARTIAPDALSEEGRPAAQPVLGAGEHHVVRHFGRRLIPGTPARTKENRKMARGISSSSAERGAGPRGRAVLRRRRPRRGHHRPRRARAEAAAQRDRRRHPRHRVRPGRAARRSPTRLADLGESSTSCSPRSSATATPCGSTTSTARLRLVTLKLVGYTEVDPHTAAATSPTTRRSSSSAASPATGPIQARRRSRP